MTIPEAWEAGLAVWETAVSLSPPVAWQNTGVDRDWGGPEPLAYIDLETRQVVVNFNLLDRMGTSDSLPAVFAHEIGHHVRFPHTLGLVAALAVLEKKLIPGLNQSLTNLFFDLQVNEVVGRTWANHLAAVYRGFLKDCPTLSPVFAFYLKVYEELWPDESIIPQSFTMDYPGWASDARMFAQTFYALPDPYLQFIYFCSTFVRYIPDPQSFSYRIPMAGDVQQPDAADLGGALYGNSQVDKALEEARARGWITPTEVEAGQGTDALTVIGRLSGAGGNTAFRQALVASHYRRLVERHLFKVQVIAPVPCDDGTIPALAEPWEMGDDPRQIDWTATVLARGELAGAIPLRRDMEPDEPTRPARRVPDMEIYLDTSGSMPSPELAVNAMTLSAQILATAIIRGGGRVRAVVYSDSNPLVSSWMYDEEVARTYLLQYAGGGTVFPFDVLEESVDTEPVVRVIVSDDGFLWDMERKGAEAVMEQAIAASVRLVALLVTYSTPKGPMLRLMKLEKFQLVRVHSIDDLAQAASDLADALVPA